VNEDYLIENRPDYYYKLAAQRIEQSNDREAEEYLKKTLLLDNNYWAASHALGELCRKTLRYEEAYEYFLATVKINPSAGHSYAGLGYISYYYYDDLDKAIFYIKEAIKYEPDNPHIHWMLSRIYLRSGNLYDGFIEYEWRKKNQKDSSYKPSLILPQWQGEIFSGKKLLVYWEQGFGDTLQFIRYLPHVKMRGGFVAFFSQKPLRRLLENFSGIDCIYDDRINLREFDLCVPLLSLPMIFGTTLNTIPNAVPYVVPKQDIIDNWRPHINVSGLYKVGLVWSGKDNPDLQNRLCCLSDLVPVATVKNVAFYSLQVGEAAGQIKDSPPDLEIINLTDDINDFADTAGAIMNLDLIISIDTSVPHLAGALGKPTWIALPYYSEWRWLTEREDSPWYPTVRLYRQKKEGDWNSVFTRMAEDLNNLVNSPR
jgi:hypothetical protein